MIKNIIGNEFVIKNKFIFLVFIFFFTRIIIYNYFEIQINTPNYGYHLLDISLLKNDLFNSLIYLHSQPPLWNLFNGIIAKIMNGEINLISKFFNIYHCFLTLLIIYFSIKILREFYLNNKIELFIFFFITLNPSIIFFENIFHYTHTTLFFFTLNTYNIIKLFKTNNYKYEIYIYLNILILSFMWILFQPILLLIVFLSIRLLRKNSKKVFFVFSLIFIISLSPMIKNKIIFGVLTPSSKSGVDFGTVFYDWRDYCGDPQKEMGIYEKKYLEEYNSTFDHPSLVGEKSGYNNLGIIVLGKNCFKVTLKRIIQNPLVYLEDRGKAFLASHGKFAFDYVYPNPIGWKKYYENVSNLYKNKKVKLSRQAIIFTIMMYIYFTILHFIFFSKNNNELKKGLLVSSIPYIYLLSVGTLGAANEQERILYTGFVVYILFFIILLRKNRN
jgi:hypothetical protein